MSKTILIVDDSASVRQVVAMTLRGAGYEVIEAQDGKDALSKLNGQRVHLIVSDVNMPVMNGIELLKAVRAWPVNKSNPVIMLPSESSYSMNDERRAAGSEARMVMPFRRAEILAAAANLVA